MKSGLRQLIAFTLMAGAMGSVTQVGFAPPAQAADLEEYQRKYISFYQNRPVSYDQYIVRGFQQELPRFDYQLLGTGGASNLLEFLNSVKTYQKENAGQLAANQEGDNIKIGDKVVSWSDTKRIMESAYVFSTDWIWSDLDLGNLRRKSKNSSTWVIDLKSNLKMELDIFKLSGSEPTLYKSLNTSWNISKTYELNNFDDILDLVKESTGGAVDADNVLVQPLIVEVIKKIPFYADLLEQDPETVLRTAAEARLSNNGSTGLVTEIKRLNDFILKNQIDKADMAQDQVHVNLTGNETVKTLGVGLDNGFKIIEYRMQNGQEEPVEIGFAKVRKLENSHFELQPIIVGRDYETGDQMIEHPKSGLGVGFSFGTVPIGFAGQDQEQFVPQASLDIEYNLAEALDISELYFTFLGGIAMPQQAKSQATVPSGLQVATGASALPIDLEVGLMKRWYMRQLVFSLGLRGGLLAASLLGSELANTPTALGLGGTALAGLHYQATADMILGVNVGWRYFTDAKFSVTTSGTSSSTSDVAYPEINSNGLVLQAFLNYAF
jgi:hypothetical protein